MLLVLALGAMLVAAAPPEDRPAAGVAASYPIPRGALFVSPAGSDHAGGTERAPLRTLAAAVRRGRSGDTVVLRGGTYRESAGIVRERLTIQPYPGERVALKGSAVIDEWTRSPAGWVHTGWSPALCEAHCYLPEIIDPAHPLAGRPEMVFLDGAALRQVRGPAEVRPGTFFADPANGTVLLGDDPTGRLVEVTRHEQLLRFDGPGAAGSVLRGVHIAHYGSRQQYGARGAMVVVNAPAVTISEATFAWSASTGLAVFQRDARVLRSVLEHNGLAGLMANRADDLRLIGNVFRANNTELFALRGEAIGAAGVKVTRTKRPYVEGNTFIGNRATGWWCDLGCTDATVIGNLAAGNAVHGLYYEVSSRALIAGNQVRGNQRLGVKLSSSDHVRLERNVFFGNRISLGVYNDKRGPESDWYSHELGLRWITTGTVLVGNTFQQRAEHPFIVHASYKPTPVPTLIERSVGNTFQRTG